jgi:hypothetical protein
MRLVERGLVGVVISEGHIHFILVLEEGVTDVFLFLEELEAFTLILYGLRFSIFAFGLVASLLAVLFFLEFLEGAGGLTPEGEVGEFIVLGGGEGEVGGDEDVLILEVLLAADDRDDYLVGQRHSI